MDSNRDRTLQVTIVAAIISGIFVLLTYLSSHFMRTERAGVAHIQLQINEIESRESMTDKDRQKLDRLILERDRIMGIE